MNLNHGFWCYHQFFQEPHGVLWLTSSLLLLDLVFYLLHGALPSWDGLEGHLHCFVLQSSPMFLHPSFLIVIEPLILSLGKETTHTWMPLESILVLNFDSLMQSLFLGSLSLFL